MPSYFLYSLPSSSKYLIFSACQIRNTDPSSNILSEVVWTGLFSEETPSWLLRISSIQEIWKLNIHEAYCSSTVVELSVHILIIVAPISYLSGIIAVFIWPWELVIYHQNAWYCRVQDSLHGGHGTYYRIFWNTTFQSGWLHLCQNRSLGTLIY